MGIKVLPCLILSALLFAREKSLTYLILFSSSFLLEYSVAQYGAMWWRSGGNGGEMMKYV